MAICDTSVLLAAADPKEPAHTACGEVLIDAERLVISPLVIAEFDYLMTTRIGRWSLERFYEDIADDVYEVVPVDNRALMEAHSVDNQYADLTLGITDAVNVVIAAMYGTNQILSLDHHYRAVTPLSEHTAFEVKPFREKLR